VRTPGQLRAVQLSEVKWFVDEQVSQLRVGSSVELFKGD
jgi:hypothetical protein